MQNKMVKKQIYKNENVVVNIINDDIISILTEHGLIRIYPNRGKEEVKKRTGVTINTDEGKLDYEKLQFSFDTEEILDCSLYGYTPDSDYWS
jgi:hypothetical protein